MKIACGILAHNEEDQIGRLIADLMQQSIFDRSDELDAEISVTCVANGCQDQTAGAARHAFEAAWSRQQLGDRVHYAVEVLAEGGKINAWNHFIHSVASEEDEFVILVDADIQFNQLDTLDRLVALLRDSPEVQIATTLPQKDIQTKQHKSLLDRISLAISRINAPSRKSALCGQLYGARSALLRRFRIPKGIICEDQFIALMARSNLLAEPEDSGHVRIADEATHVFAAYTHPRNVIQNLVRQAMGHQIFLITLRWLQGQIKEDGGDAGVIMKREDHEDPEWLLKLIRATVRERGRWVIEAHGPIHRFKHLGRFRWLRRVALLPAAMCAAVADAYVLFVTNHRMRAMNFEAPGRRH